MQKGLSSFIFLLSIFYLWALNAVGIIYGELAYKTEQFHHRAHEKMNDHGVNEIYHINLDGVMDILPQTHEIKRKIVRRVNKDKFPAKLIVMAVRHHMYKKSPYPYKRVFPMTFFSAFREGVPFTYVILKDRLVLTESTHDDINEKVKSRYSKHYYMSGLKGKVHYAGELFIYKNYRNGDIFLVFDNASGTYCPDGANLSQVKDLLKYNFYNPKKQLYFFTKTFEEKVNKRKLFAHHPNPFIKKTKANHY